VEAPANVIYELPGDGMLENEAGGRELSEKEAMRIREERYNGTNPNPTTPVRTTRPAVVNQSPVSPVTPGAATTHTNDSVISPISPSATTHRTISNALADSPRKKVVKGDEIEPVPVLRRTESEKVEKDEVGPSRKRFSWEDRIA
jgi:hypothetical protein